MNNLDIGLCSFLFSLLEETQIIVLNCFSTQLQLSSATNLFICFESYHEHGPASPALHLVSPWGLSSLLGLLWVPIPEWTRWVCAIIWNAMLLLEGTNWSWSRKSLRGSEICSVQTGSERADWSIASWLTTGVEHLLAIIKY